MAFSIDKFIKATEGINTSIDKVSTMQLPTLKAEVKANAGSSMIGIIVFAVVAIVVAIFWKKKKK